MFIINRSQSPFGAARWLAGLETLKNLNPNEKVWIGGDGSARFFLNWGSPPYQTISDAPQYDRKDSLAYNPGTSGWTRWTPEGRTVAFNSQGQHTSTTNRFGRVTAFGFAGSLLSSISLPAPTGMSYGFGCTSGRLTSVTAPPIGAQTRVTTLGNPAGQLVSIRNPGDSVVLFQYKTAAADLHLIDQRTNRRSVSTSFTYDATRRVATSSVTPGGGAGIITWALTHGETRGLMGVPAVDTTRVYTKIDGPRAVADTTVVFAQRFGHPRKTVDAVGAVTRAQHDGCGGVDSDCSWLVFRLDNPVGHKTLFDWDLFGLAKGTLNVVTSTRDTSLTLADVTRYEWDPTFNQLTKIVPPEGDSMRFGGDSHSARRESSWASISPKSRTSCAGG